MNPFFSTMRAPALLWTAVALTVSLVPVSPAGHIAFAATAALCVGILPRPALVRLTSALAMIPIAIADAPTWSFVAAGGLLATVLAQPAADALPAPLEQIQRHLEWCRRRGEAAHLLWVHAPHVDRDTATAALDAFRVTDNPALLHEGDEREEIVAMVDHASFERDGLERRLRAHVGEAAGFGWATFPEDGVTLEALFQRARAAAVASSEQPPHPSTQLQASFRRWGSRPPTGAPARSPNQG
jgi:hypothetical protein